MRIALPPYVPADAVAADGTAILQREALVRPSGFLQQGNPGRLARGDVQLQLFPLENQRLRDQASRKRSSVERNETVEPLDQLQQPVVRTALVFDAAVENAALPGKP